MAFEIKRARQRWLYRDSYATELTLKGKHIFVLRPVAYGPKSEKSLGIPDLKGNMNWKHFMLINLKK